jgi:hypothetical protein
MASTIITTQRTAKRWKFLKVIGGLTFFAGSYGLMVSAGYYNPGQIPVGTIASVVCLVLGPLVWLTGKTGAWWCHV